MLEALNNSHVRYERYGAHFKPGELDPIWLPRICQQGWIILTKDKGIRYNQLEIKAICADNAREFFFRSGNWDGKKMAEILSKALPKMKRMARRISPPFIASLTEAGEVHLRYDKGGSVHDQKKKSET